MLGFDAFVPLVDFWQQALKDRMRLADEVTKHHPLTVENFKRLQAEGHRLQTQLERAAAFYVLNRTSFSGTTCSGGMSPGHARFNLKAIERLRQFRAPNLWVEQADFKESIQRHPNGQLFCDPPYITARRLYGRNGNLHDDFDHEALRDLLRDRGQWLLCYGDCSDARYMYGGRRIVPLQWKYGMNRSKQSNEAVILSDDLQVPCALCAERLRVRDPLTDVLEELRR